MQGCFLKMYICAQYLVKCELVHVFLFLIVYNNYKLIEFGVNIMGLGVNTNISSMQNINNLNKLQPAIQSNLEKLSSGKKVNSAKDDAAAIAIIEQFASQIMGANQAHKNVSDAVSLTQVAEGYTSSISDLTQRARDLSMQSSNGVMSDTDRAALQTEYAQIQEEVLRITDSASFNGQNLLNQKGELSMQVDANSGDQVNLQTYDLKSQLAGFFASDISTQAGSQSAISTNDDSLSSVNTIRAEYGATSNRFESIATNLLNKEVNLEASKSRIADTDYAKQTSDLTKNMILSQAGIAVQSQSNISQNMVMGLLR
jgi:flagellin